MFATIVVNVWIVLMSIIVVSVTVMIIYDRVLLSVFMI